MPTLPRIDSGEAASSPATTGMAARAYFSTKAAGRRYAPFLGYPMLALAVATWFLPIGSLPPQIAFAQLFLSLSFGFLGLAFLQSTRSAERPRIEIDTIRRELRLVRGSGRRRKVTGQYKFRDFSHVEFIGDLVRIWDGQGSILADFELRDEEKIRSLRAGLRDEGKLA